MATKKSTDSGALYRTTDLRGFIRQLERAAGPERMDKARALLREASFVVSHEVTADHLGGVVQPTPDPAVLNACRIQKDGRYMCCTNDLEPCSGLGDNLCDHLLALILLLVQFGGADAHEVSEWITLAAGRPASLDREAMSAALAKPRGE